jgi:hypothetical protein
MEPGEVLDALVDLAREVGLEVKRLPSSRPGSEPELPARSGACRLRGRLLVLLAPADSVEDRIEAMVHGLRGVDPQLLEGRWIPPAVRERLEGAGGA